MLDFDYMAPEVISNAVRLMKNPEEHVICGIKYVPEKRCEGCAYDEPATHFHYCEGCSRDVLLEDKWISPKKSVV